MLSKLHETFIQLVCLGIGTSKDVKIFDIGAAWTEIKALAERHGLSAIVMNGIDRCLEKNSSITKEIRLAHTISSSCR